MSTLPHILSSLCSKTGELSYTKIIISIKKLPYIILKILIRQLCTLYNNQQNNSLTVVTDQSKSTGYGLVKTSRLQQMGNTWNNVCVELLNIQHFTS